MGKSKFVFLIMFFGYIAIAILNAFNITSVGDEILLGLSLCALKMSLSDSFSIIKVISLKRNHLKYIAKITSKFIDKKLNQNVQVHSSIVNIRNLKKNVEQTNKGYEKSQHPTLYESKKCVKFLIICEHLLFVISIFVFVMTPFWHMSIEIASKMAVFITLLAFGFMCFNVFLSEIDLKESERHYDFLNNTQIIINSVFSDFTNFLNKQLYYREDLIAEKKAHDDILDKELNDLTEEIINDIEKQPTLTNN